MPAYNFIKSTIVGNANQTIALDNAHHGIAIDNFSSSAVTYTPNNDNITRSVPALSARALEFAIPFSQIVIEANGNYEVHIFN